LSQFEALKTDKTKPKNGKEEGKISGVAKPPVFFCPFFHSFAVWFFAPFFCPTKQGRNEK